MLEVRDLSVRYGAVEAVRGIDVSVGSGDVVALLGPNGAGKTSTLRAATGLVRYSGSVTFEGTEVTKLGPEGCAKRGLIHVPEGRHVFPTLSVHENLQVGRTAARGRPGYSFDDVYDLFPALTHLRDRTGWALSGRRAADGRHRSRAGRGAAHVVARRAFARSCADRRQGSVRGAPRDPGRTRRSSSSSRTRHKRCDCATAPRRSPRVASSLEGSAARDERPFGAARFVPRPDESPHRVGGGELPRFVRPDRGPITPR